MEPAPRTIYYYETSDGYCPFVEWRDALKDQAFVDALRARLARLRLGLFGHSDPIGQGVLELKFDMGPGYRVYFGVWSKSILVLLCGGNKSTQRRQDIHLAKTYWEDFRRSNK